MENRAKLHLLGLEQAKEQLQVAHAVVASDEQIARQIQGTWWGETPRTRHAGMITPQNCSGEAAVDLPDWWGDLDQLRLYTQALQSDELMEKTIRTLAKQVYKEPIAGQLAEMSATRQNFIRGFLAHMRGRQMQFESEQEELRTLAALAISANRGLPSCDQSVREVKSS